MGKLHNVRMSVGTPAGALLRQLRESRRLTQLELALEAGVSVRHLSYVETGRSQPSRALLSRLSLALDIPLRARNSLLVAAGFAPEHAETPLNAEAMRPMLRAIEYIIGHQEPYPAIVVDRYWNVVMRNDASKRVIERVLGRPSRHTNIMRRVFDPSDVRPIIANWDEVAGELIRHLHEDVAASPNDAQGKALLDEVLAYPGVPTWWRDRPVTTSPAPLLATTFRNDELELRFFSTITTFGTPRDVTLAELRIESLFPCDDETAAACREFSSR